MRALSAAGMTFVFAQAAGISFHATSAAVLALVARPRAAYAATAIILLLLCLAPAVGERFPWY